MSTSDQSVKSESPTTESKPETFHLVYHSSSRLGLVSIHVPPVHIHGPVTRDNLRDLREHAESCATILQQEKGRNKSVSWTPEGLGKISMDTAIPGKPLFVAELVIEPYGPPKMEEALTPNPPKHIKEDEASTPNPPKRIKKEEASTPSPPKRIKKEQNGSD